MKRPDLEPSGAFVETVTVEPKGSGILTDLRFAAKDLIDLEGYKTSCGNPTWRDTHPVAATNAVCVDQLLFAGATCIGKTITDELAFGLDGENSFYGTPLNPKAPNRVPGGSSSGSASAVACGMADFALGTDTGGSIRVPASNCGIFGMRPSHGRISVAGVNPLAPTFDTVGVLACNCEVLAKAASVLLACDIPPGVEVGAVHLLEEAFAACDPEVKDAVARPVEMIKALFPGKVRKTSLQEIGEEASETGLRGWYHTYCHIQWAEIWSCLGGWVQDAKPEFGARTRVNFELVKNMDRQTIVKALRSREICFSLLKEFLGPNDLLCMPTTPTLAPNKGSLGIDRTTDRYFPRTLSMTAIAGIGRLPQVTLPVADASGVPVGLSLLAGQGRDAFLVAAAQMVASELFK
ncbi:MAG: amidase [Desulfomonile tiedjei]|nr:amidase [Desulfomonile tiedjei]